MNNLTLCYCNLLVIVISHIQCNLQLLYESLQFKLFCKLLVTSRNWTKMRKINSVHNQRRVTRYYFKSEIMWLTKLTRSGRQLNMLSTSSHIALPQCKCPLASLTRSGRQLNMSSSSSHIALSESQIFFSKNLLGGWWSGSFSASLILIAWSFNAFASTIFPFCWCQ